MSWSSNWFTFFCTNYPVPRQHRLELSGVQRNSSPNKGRSDMISMWQATQMVSPPSCLVGSFKSSSARRYIHFLCRRLSSFSTNLCRRPIDHVMILFGQQHTNLQQDSQKLWWICGSHFCILRVQRPQQPLLHSGGRRWDDWAGGWNEEAAAESGWESGSGYEFHRSYQDTNQFFVLKKTHWINNFVLLDQSVTQNRKLSASELAIFLN